MAFTVPWPFEVAEPATAADDSLEPMAGESSSERAEQDPPEHVMVVYDALTAIAVVGRSDMVALVPRRFAEINARQHGIVILDTAGTHGGFEVFMLWHNRLRTDSGLTWLRALIHEASRSD